MHFKLFDECPQCKNTDNNECTMCNGSKEIEKKIEVNQYDITILEVLKKLKLDINKQNLKTIVNRTKDIINKTIDKYKSRR